MNLMLSLQKLLIISSILVLVSVAPVFAQSPTPVIPTPEPGFNQSDFAKDVAEGERLIKNDDDEQNNQRQIDENEVDEGQQENEDVHTDEKIDQSEAQEEQGGAEGQAVQEEVKGNKNGKNTSVQDEGGKEQKDSETNSTKSTDTNED